MYLYAHTVYYPRLEMDISPIIRVPRRLRADAWRRTQLHGGGQEMRGGPEMRGGDLDPWRRTVQ
jgi:hypothetical protein